MQILMNYFHKFSMFILYHMAESAQMNMMSFFSFDPYDLLLVEQVPSERDILFLRRER